MSHDGSSDEVTAARLLAVLPHLLHTLRRDRWISAAQEQDPVAGMLLERRGQVRLLYTLHQRGSMTTQEIAHYLEVAPPTVSTMVHALAAHELVTRERDAADQRQVWISLSARGRDAVDHERARAAAVFLERYRRLSPADRAAIASAVPALERLLETSSASCAARKVR